MIAYSCYCAELAGGVKGKKNIRVVEENPSGKKRLLNTPAYCFYLFGLQVVLFFLRKKKLYLLRMQLLLYVPNLTEQLSVNYT